MPKIKYFAKWIGLCLCFGVVCGIVGALFFHAISLVTATRQNNPWAIYLLPVVAPLCVFVYKALKIDMLGSNNVILTARGKEKLPFQLAPAVFISSMLSHLFGASVGRESAAIQIGGGFASLFEKIFKTNEKESRVLTFCSISGLFSAVFGTPLAAALFAVEVVCIGQIQFFALIPALITSLVAFFVALGLKIHPERFALVNTPDFSGENLIKTLIIILACILASIAFCYALKYSRILFKKFIKNPYIRIAVGGVITLGVTLILGNRDYLGAGVNIIEEIFEGGEIVPYAFAIKLVLTAVCVGAGFKGGEIVPSLFIGATLGGTLATLLGLSAPLGAAVGMITLFCSVTNCPFASILLGLEMFSGKGSIYIIFAFALSYLLSTKISLYSAQEIKGFKSKF